MIHYVTLPLSMDLPTNLKPGIMVTIARRSNYIVRYPIQFKYTFIPLCAHHCSFPKQRVVVLQQNCSSDWQPGFYWASYLASDQSDCFGDYQVLVSRKALVVTWQTSSFGSWWAPWRGGAPKCFAQLVDQKVVVRTASGRVGQVLSSR